MKVRWSNSWTNLKTSPPTPQPKQWYTFLAGLTVNDGDFSSWNGHRPFRLPPPAFFSWTTAPTTSTTEADSRTRWMSSSLIRPATAEVYPRAVTVRTGLDVGLRRP